MYKVLYIEDTENNRILIARKLGQSGYKVLTAENAEEGMALARAEQPHLILMDMGLPQVDGWSATRQFKADSSLSHIPIIALTAHAMHGEREKALAAGCDEYETKPFQFARLLSKMEMLMKSPDSTGRADGVTESPPASQEDAWFQLRHDLCNPLGNILGFCEILGQPDQPARDQDVKLGLRAISESATQMVKTLKQTPLEQMSGDEIKNVQSQLKQQGARILEINQTLIDKAAATQDTRLHQDVTRIRESALRVANMVDAMLFPKTAA